MFSVATSEEASESARAKGCPRHGSWNRTKKFGGDVVVVHLDKDGKVKDIQPLVTGFLQDNKYVGRPDDVMLMKDGSILERRHLPRQLRQEGRGEAITSQTSVIPGRCESTEPGNVEVTTVIARSEATKQSRLLPRKGLDCFASLAMTRKSSEANA